MPASFSSLPTEVCTMIFYESWSGSKGFVLPGPVADSISACLSMVCWKWRHIALAIPALWTAYILDFPLDPESDDTILEDDALRVVEQLLPLIARAGVHPISISTCDSYYWLTPLLQLLQKTQVPICAASLTLVEDTPDRIGLDGTFILRLEPSESQTDRLSNLRVGTEGFGFSYQWPFAYFERWQRFSPQLTSFHASKVWMLSSDCVRVLQECPRLEDCTFSIDDTELDGPRPKVLEPFCMSLPHLATMHLAFQTPIPEFWNFITLPNLRDLSIAVVHSAYIYAWEENDPPFQAFLRRSKPPLTSLSVHFDLSDYSAQWITTLAMLPTLETLALRFYVPHVEPYSEFHRLADHLCYDPSRPLALPRLHTLHLDAITYTVHMAESRSARSAWHAYVPGVRLKHVTLYAINPESVADAVERLEANGVNVKVEPIHFFGGYTDSIDTIKCFGPDVELPDDFLG
ncbi:hypothetical protein FB451DRAFT_1556793 [Mycena latifolia]|nr:hypothetical protein FB451DRAFT_1556793 [Mycena latifolia]